MPALTTLALAASLPAVSTPAPLDGLRVLISATPSPLSRAVALLVAQRAIAADLADVVGVDRDELVLTLAHGTIESALLLLPESHEQRATRLEEHEAARHTLCAGPAADLTRAVCDAFATADLVRLEDALAAIERDVGDHLDGLVVAVDRAARSVGAHELARIDRGTTYVEGTLDFVRRGMPSAACTWRALLSFIDAERESGRELSYASVSFLAGISCDGVDVTTLRAIHGARGLGIAFVTDEMVSADEPATLDEMLAANIDDAHVSSWLRSARPGDRYVGGLVVLCVEASA